MRHTESKKAKLFTAVLPELLRASPYVSHAALVERLTKLGFGIGGRTLRTYMSEAMRTDVLHDAGRGWYSALPQRLLVNPAPVSAVVARVEKAFPLLDFTCWSTEQVNPFMEHLLTKFVTFIYADKDLLPALFEELSGWREYRVYLKPGVRDARTFRAEDRTIVIRRETGEAPKGDGHAAPFEKLLVDLAIEIETLPIMSPGAFHDMARRLATSGRLSMAVLARYARRNHRRLEDIFGKEWLVAV